MKRIYPDVSQLPEAKAAEVLAYWERGYALEEKAEAASRGKGPELTDDEKREYRTFRMTAETERGGFVVVYTPPDE